MKIIYSILGTFLLISLVICFVFFFHDRVRASITALEKGDYQEKVRALNVLKEENLKDARNARAIDALIAVVNDTNENLYVRMQATETLAFYDNTKAVQPLMAFLSDQNVYIKKNAIRALVRIGEQNSIEALAGHLDMIAADYSYFLSGYVPFNAEDILAEALKRHGNIKMAEAYLNCSNSYLKNAGEIWARKNHCFIIPKLEFTRQ